jgi:hypothetical protein
MTSPRTSGIIRVQMRLSIILVLTALSVAACSQNQGSPVTTECCLIQPPADAGGNASCFCGNASSASGSSISVSVTGSSCTVTFSYKSDGGRTSQTSKGAPPASAAACAAALPM